MSLSSTSLSPSSYRNSKSRKRDRRARILEISWLNFNPELIYYRFIDDIFIASKSDLNLENFRLTFLYLKLNIVKDNEVVFLDLKISFSKILEKFQFDLYIKPTNTFGYLLPS